MSGLSLTPSVADKWACELNGVIATAPNGETAPITDCAWMQVAPCGCVSGITMAQHTSEHVLLTADAALRDMATTAADAKEDARNGYRMVLVRMVDYRAHLVDAMKGSCPHNPMWGHARRTRDVDGKTWTRLGTTEWTMRDEAGVWRLSKWSSYWHLSPPSSVPRGNGLRIPGMGSKLDGALANASRFAAEHASQAVAS